MRERAGQVEEGIDKVVKQVALRVDQSVVTATPVDTGRARSNWIASIGAPSLSVVEPTDAQTAVAGAKVVISSRRPTESIFITNNLDYIGQLNNGSSKQAPKNFVRHAVQAGAATLRNVKIFKV